MKTLLGFFLAMVCAGAAGYYYLRHFGGEAASSYRTATIKHDNMMPTISATGTAEPEETIDVGAQVAGLIKSLGRDPKDPTRSIDYGSEVEPDTVLALIDDSVYKAQLASAEAALAKSVATLIQLKATLAKADSDWKRAEELLKKNAMAQSDFDTAKAGYEVANANIAVGEAAIKQDKATLSLAQTNLGYTVIKSPVKGVIVDRRVNVGQTVVSALNAPSLFLLAKDLKRIQVWASVNEADIGKIHKGQSVHFTVDAYPSDKFVGQVQQIRLNATMTQNVVTYTVVVETDNADLRLLPYMTTNLQFELERHEGVLVVPNAALRWKPRKTQISPEYADAAAQPVGKHGPRGQAAGDDKESSQSPGEPASGGKDQGAGDHAAAADTAASAAAAKDSGAAASGANDRVKAAILDHKRSLMAAKDSATAAAASKKKRRTDAPLPAKPRDHQDWGRVWAKDGDYVRPIDVRVVATDGTNTEISGKDLQEGMEVVVGENVASDDSGDTTNPFAPKIFGKKKQ